jgi:hypothetical protein
MSHYDLSQMWQIVKRKCQALGSPPFTRISHPQSRPGRIAAALSLGSVFRHFWRGRVVRIPRPPTICRCGIRLGQHVVAFSFLLSPADDARARCRNPSPLSPLAVSSSPPCLQDVRTFPGKLHHTTTQTRCDSSNGF